jgi:hypothetical protein
MENETPLARIALELQSEEADAFSQLGFTKKRNWYHRLFRIQILAAIILGIVCYFFLGGFKEDLPLFEDTPRLLPSIFAAALFYALFFVLEVVLPLREGLQKEENKLKKEYSGLWIFAVHPEGLFVTYGKRQKTIAWQRIILTEWDEYYLYLKLDIGEHLILPRKKVLMGDFDIFVNALQERVKDAPRTNIKLSDESFPDY